MNSITRKKERQSDVVYRVPTVYKIHTRKYLRSKIIIVCRSLFLGLSIKKKQITVATVLHSTAIIRKLISKIKKKKQDQEINSQENNNKICAT